MKALKVSTTLGRFVRGTMTIAVIAGLVVGCATRPPADDPEAVAAFNESNDPMEPLNRVIFDFNITMDRYLLRPVAYVYKEATPQAVQNMVDAFLKNLQSPVILANDLLQWEWERAGVTVVRFAMNTGFGFGGVADIAGEMGFTRHEEDFGQTLAVYGLSSGPYLMLPFLGPANPRDGFGRIVDTAFDPTTYFGVNWAIETKIPLGARIGRAGAGVISFRAKNYDAINDLERTSLDYYAAVRSLFWQRRRDEIRNGRANEKRSEIEIPEEFRSLDQDKPEIAQAP